MHDNATSFLKSQGWDGATLEAISGDLSQRSYFRLSRNGENAILMDAGGDRASVPPFLRMTAWLRQAGLSAPEILGADVDNALLLLEDLGPVPASEMMSHRAAQADILDACIEILLAIRNAPPPPLHCPGAERLCDWTRVADEHFPGADSGALDEFRVVLKDILSRLLTEGCTVSLRDFHADNLMPLPHREGVARLGVLDYQDAFLTHPVYDLVSLLTDARVEVPPAIRARYIERYASVSGDGLARLRTAFAAFSAQRNLRILGIFHRAARVLGRTRHLPKVPRVYRCLMEATEHEAFRDVRGILRAGLPAPEMAA
ncbi:MAG: phosphotransferase [Boseongicola sp. SB0670_bin_30]|nr:phosphotransferase [Boseongicola sp. SB0670_bin_30]